jgi:hypothetical protein
VYTPLHIVDVRVDFGLDAEGSDSNEMFVSSLVVRVVRTTLNCTFVYIQFVVSQKTLFHFSTIMLITPLQYLTITPLHYSSNLTILHHHNLIEMITFALSVVLIDL